MRLGQIGVRRARVSDAEALARVHDAAWRGAYRGIIPGVALEKMVQRRGPAWWAKAIDRKASILLLEVGGAAAGYATVGPSRMRSLPYAGEVFEIYLSPEHQGLGLGRHLFGAAKMELGRHRLLSFAVRVLRENEPACRFYRRLGGELAAETAERVGDSILPVVVYGWPTLS